MRYSGGTVMKYPGSKATRMIIWMDKILNWGGALFILIQVGFLKDTAALRFTEDTQKEQEQIFPFFRHLPRCVG